MGIETCKGIKNFNLKKAMRNTVILQTIMTITTGVLLWHTTIAQNAGEQPFQGTIGKTLNDSKEWWAQPAKAPANAPNIVWIILDDVGFGATSTFGGLIHTPTLDSLANNGL